MRFAIERRHVLIVLSAIQVLLTAGIVFGWSNIVVSLRNEGYYSEVCTNQTITTVRFETVVLA
jgi:hypothetical protein